MELVTFFFVQTGFPGISANGGREIGIWSYYPFGHLYDI